MNKADNYNEQFSGVHVLTNPQNCMIQNSNLIGPDHDDPKVPFVMGTPALPVCIRVQKDPEPLFMKFLQITQMIMGIIFIFIMIGFIVSVIGSNGGGLNQSVNSHHQLVLHSTVRFKDVQGCDEIKAQLEQAVEFLKNPSKFEKFGASLPRGYLLEGPPGVGKTMLAKAVAGEAGVPFLVISGAEFDEVYVGVGAARVRSLFKDARSHTKAVIFIDEIDAVASKRENGNDRANSRQTLNQLLVEMDGFRTGSSVIVLGATNTVQTLDPAMLRPGRFDKTLTISPPDIAGRTQILIQLLSMIPSKNLASDVKANGLAATTIGYTGADLANLVNQAKLIAATENKSFLITKEHFQKAQNLIDLGPKRSMVLSDEEKAATAYHEAGHALVALATPNSFPVHHATIVPHGKSLGLVLSSPDKDIVNYSRAMLQARVDMALGGFIAEELKYGAKNVSTGPASDLKYVNTLANYMVSSGFGKRTGFLQPFTEIKNNASEMAKQNFEADVQDILNESRQRVTELLKSQEKAWTAIAEALIKQESLNRQDLETLYKNNKSPLPDNDSLLKAKMNKRTPETSPEA